GCVAILSALARYEAQDEKESEHIGGRVVIMIYMRNMSRGDFNKQLIRKMVQGGKADIMVHLPKENDMPPKSTPVSWGEA
ncbi:hypothetical protein BGW80DRAFT_1290936, partial [Lactifluus volemus]